MREDIFTGPRSDQPRDVHYAALSWNRMTSRSTTHLVADTYPIAPEPPCALGIRDRAVARKSGKSEVLLSPCSIVPPSLSRTL